MTADELYMGSIYFFDAAVGTYALLVAAFLYLRLLNGLEQNGEFEDRNTEAMFFFVSPTVLLFLTVYALFSGYDGAKAGVDQFLQVTKKI